MSGDFARRGVVAVIERDGLLLVIKRSRHVIAPGTLCFPGGGIEADETPSQALIRECDEEIGLKIVPLREIWQNVTPWNVHLRWWTAVPADPDAPLRPNPREVEAVFWMAPEEIAAHPDLLQSNIPFLKFLNSSFPTHPTDRA